MTLAITAGRQTITQNTEFSIAQNANYSSGSPKTTTGYVQAWVDLTGISAGDVVQVRIYRAINGGTAAAIDVASVVTPQLLALPGPMLMGGNWDISVKLTTATSRSIRFEVVQDDTAATATLGAGAITSTTFAAGAITATAIASAALTAAKFAADAIDANALAANAVTEIQTGLATSAAQTTAQTDLTTLTGRLTSTRATNLDNLDAAVTTRAAAATAVSNADYTSVRAGKLDQLDAAVSTRAAAATALSTAQWTNGRAVALDNLDVASSTRASALSLSVVGSAVATVNLDTDDIQAKLVTMQADVDGIDGRIPASLDAGNMRASVQSLSGASTTAIAVAVLATVVEAGIDVAGMLRLLAANAVGKLTGKATNAYKYRDLADTKDRISGTVTSDGRSSITLDAT